MSDVNITNEWFCAIDCLAVGLYAPSILFASISVECILNNDMRLEAWRQERSHEWILLNTKNLKHAYEKGLPTNLLLNVGETFETDIEFVMRRNKVAHGDVRGYRSMYPSLFDLRLSKELFDETELSFGYYRPAKEHAFGQIDKAKRFIIAWARQKPTVRLC